MVTLRGVRGCGYSERCEGGGYSERCEGVWLL